MATDAVSEIRPEFECPVCHKYYTDPKILPCAHLLCRQCLISRLQSYINTQCPICHTLVADPKDRATKSYAEIANALPTDVTMVNLVESARKLSKSHVCCACEDVAAAFICLDCGDMLCNSCVKVHSKLSSTRYHTTEDFTKMTAERLASIGRVSCTDHAGEQAQCKLFCPSHGVSICHICATSSHSACPEVTELEGQMAEARNVLKVLVEMLSEGESKLERAIGQLDKHLVDVDKKTEAILVDIDTAFDRLHKCMESRRKQLKEMAANANSEAKASAQDGKTVFTERRERLTSHKQLVKRAQGVSNPRFADDVKTSLMMRVEGLDRSAVLPNGSKVISMPSLVLEQEAIDKVMEELEGLGQVYNLPTLSSLQQGDFMTTHFLKKTEKTFCFHENHGQNIVLSNRQRTAERVRDVDHGIVLSNEPMDENLLYEVLIEHNDPSPSTTMLAGVVTVDPAELVLPNCSSDLPEPISVVFDNGTYRSFDTTYWISGGVGGKLRNMPVGSRAGLYVDDVKRLHFVFDGHDQGIVHKYIHDRCYAFFDIRYSYKKITALPRTPMPPVLDY